MNIHQVEFLLSEVSHISKRYKEITKLSGDDFNVFKLLNLQTNEVRTHSAILADLLNPKGSHGQEDLFLKLFTEQFGITDFNTKSARAEAESYIGPIKSDHTKGGIIDILITDAGGKHIMIENKIYAGDQKNQLLRYHNFDPKGYLFYLNLDGAEPTDYSIGNLDKKSYKVISYQQHIIEWLEKCRREAVALPIIRETIAQYILLLKYLTNQTDKNKMEQEIKTLLQKNPDYIDSIDQCSRVLQSIITETKEKFEKIFDEMFLKITKELGNDHSIVIYWEEDGDGVFFGYHLESKVENTELKEKYSAILKDIDPRFHSSNWCFGWFNPSPFKRCQKFEHLDKKEILKMSADDTYLKKFIEDLIRQEKEIRMEFFSRIGLE